MAFPLILGLGGGIAIGTQFSPQIKAGAKNVMTQIKGTTGATDKPVESEETPKTELQGPSKDTFSGSKKSSSSEGKSSSTDQASAEASGSQSSSPLEDTSTTVDKIIGSDSKPSSTIPA